MKKVTAFLSALLALTLAAAPCVSAAESAVSEADSVAEEAAGGDVNLYVLSGPTGIGAMNLWEASENGETQNTYNVTIDAQNVSDFVRVVDLFDSLQVRARMA